MSLEPHYFAPDDMQKQLRYEQDMQEEGIADHRASVQKARDAGRESSTSSGTYLLRHILNPSPARREEGYRPFNEVIQEFIDKSYSGKSGAKAAAAVLLKENDIEADVAGFITVKTVLDSITQKEKYTSASIKIGGQIENEARYRNFKEEHPDLVFVLARDNKKATPKFRSRLLKGYANKVGHEWKAWTLTDKAKLGAKLIDLLIEATGLVEMVREKKIVPGRSPKDNLYIQATPETMEWILAKHEHDELLYPNYMPTIVPPKRWTNPFNGGYWSEALRKTPLIKTRNTNYLEDLANQEMPEVYDSVNLLQETAWQVNKEVLQVMTHFWNYADDCACLPTRNPLPLPPKPIDIETNEEARKQWRIETTKVHQQNRARMSKAFQIRKILVIAEKYEEEKAIYFPHCLDFRGRVYPIPMMLNPQGSDPCKGLLRFSEGKVLGYEGAHWLAVHGANCYGKDKLPMEERIAWVEENKEMIIQVAKDPLQNTQWMEADEPWQFLAFCFEWLSVDIEGVAYVSKIAVALDGSCNGLQHYSAALRDEVGGKAVNLVPSDKPNDIYQTVVDTVLPQVKQDAAGGSLEAKEWLDSGLLTRKITKRPTMTMVYGATKYGMKEQVHLTLKELYPDIRDIPFESDGWPAACYMGNLIFDSLAMVVSKASEAMDWLQEAAKLAAKEELPIYWKTPVGLFVQQAYKKEKVKKINIFSGEGIRLRLSVSSLTDKLNKAKQSSGIAPNFVHSLDAAHMMRTVVKCADKGIKSFAMIHDSFGTHAADALELATSLRESFVEIHSHNILEDLRNDLLIQLSEENANALPPLPSIGQLELTDVMDSVYFFA